jgi:hypothetical protein
LVNQRVLRIRYVEIEITAQQARRRQDLTSVGLVVPRSRRLRAGRRFLLQLQQPVNLGFALAGRVILEMRIDDPQRTERRPHRDLQRVTAHAARSTCSRPRQKVIGNLQHRQPRQCHVPEPMQSALPVDRFDRRAEHRQMVGQQFGKLRALICTAIEPGEVGRYFLEAEHICIGHLFCHRNDPRQVGYAVATLSALDIPRDQPHQRMPARMKDCTNWR